MKVLFLDCDGVINCSKSFIRKEGEDYPYDPVDPEMMARVNKIIEVTGCMVVVSSAWRQGRSLVELREYLGSKGLKGSIIGKTPRLDHRREEISDWLQGWNFHREPITHFVVIDDSLVFEESDSYFPNFVHTSWYEGIQDEHVEKAIEILSKP